MRNFYQLTLAAVIMIALFVSISHTRRSFYGCVSNPTFTHGGL